MNEAFDAFVSSAGNWCECGLPRSVCNCERKGLKTMNERPGINLGVIEDMESTLLPDNHTVKARGVWLMDGDTASIFYEGSALGSVQHELSCLKDAIRKLSNVGELFDGRDECNEYTHEENNKVMEAALDQIYELVRRKPRINPSTSLTGHDDGDFDRANYEFGGNIGLD